jgi:hypothetical protein
MSTEMVEATPDAQTQDTPQTDVLSVVNETVVFAVTRSTTKPDSEPGFGVYKEGNALWKRSNPDEKGDTSAVDTEIVFTVTADIPVAHSIAGLSQVVTDEEELVNLANNGIYDKVVAQLRSKYIQRKEGEFIYGADTVSAEDVVEIASTPLKRRSISDSAKAVKVLSKLSQADLTAALKAMGLL